MRKRTLDTLPSLQQVEVWQEEAATQLRQSYNLQPSISKCQQLAIQAVPGTTQIIQTIVDLLQEQDRLLIEFSDETLSGDRYCMECGSRSWEGIHKDDCRWGSLFRWIDELPKQEDSHNEVQ